MAKKRNPKKPVPRNLGVVEMIPLKKGPHKDRKKQSDKDACRKKGKDTEQ